MAAGDAGILQNCQLPKSHLKYGCSKMAVPSWGSEGELRHEGTVGVCPVFVEELGRAGVLFASVHAEVFKSHGKL